MLFYGVGDTKHLSSTSTIKLTIMKFHIFWTFFWNWSQKRKHKWIFDLFPNKICISFYSDESPITAKDLWDQSIN